MGIILPMGLDELGDNPFLFSFFGTTPQINRGNPVHAHENHLWAITQLSFAECLSIWYRFSARTKLGHDQA